MRLHELSNIDTAAREADCAQCGHVRIHVVKGGWYCKAPLKGVWRHRVEQVDPEQRVGVCAVCGPVKVVRRRGGQTWQCRTSKGVDKIREHRKHVGDTCERCGFEPEHLCQLDVHHLNGDHGDNNPANLRTLCANCHRLEHFAH